MDGTEYRPLRIAEVSDGRDTWQAFRLGQGWESFDPGIGFVADEQVTDVRPLLVFNWAYPEKVARRLRDGHILTASDIADQIEAQMRPPRIPEPGLWGIVSAREVNAITEHDWVHLPTGAWASLGGSRVSTWSNLVDPVLIREGVES